MSQSRTGGERLPGDATASSVDPDPVSAGPALRFRRETARLDEYTPFCASCDIEALAALRLEAEGGDLTAKRESVSRLLKHGRIFALTRDGALVASFCLTEKKPWAIDTRYFTKVVRPLDLVAMVVAPDHQRCGLGTQGLIEVGAIATRWPADAIRLDAHDGPGGAGPFYERNGYCEVGRASYRGTPLIYYECVIGSSAKT